MSSRQPVLHKSATQELEKMFRLSRREGSTMWQVRKRWPSEVAPVLRGEFTKSTGEADRTKARATLPLIAAEYESKVQQARDRLADNRYRDLAEPEIARLTAQFYRTALPSYRIKRALSPAEAQAMLVEVQSRVAAFESAQARQDYAVGEVTAHGLRTTASTLLNESGKWSADAIERSLAHADKDAVRGTYNRGTYWEERVAMHQWWSDYLDTLREGSVTS